MRPLRHSAPRGFTLIELMVALVVMAAVIAGIYGSFFRSQGQSAKVTSVAEKRQQGRAAIQLIERETRMAGSGWGRLPVQYSNNGTADTLESIQPGPDSSSAGLVDSLVMVGAWQAASTLSGTMTTPTSALNVTSATGFVTNDLIILTNGQSAHLFRITGITGNTLAHASTSTYNVFQASPSSHPGWPPGGYSAGTRIYKATITSYYMNTTTYRRPALMRREFGQAPQVVAYDINAFRVWYLMQDGTWTRNPFDLDFVDKIAPVVEVETDDGRSAAVTESTWAVVRPRTF